MKSGWIHLTLECPEIPYEAYEEKEPQYPSLLSWYCGQVGQYARECSLQYRQTETQHGKIEKPSINGEATYPLEVGTGPRIVDGYLYRPGPSSFTGKPTSHPIKSFTLDKPSKGAPEKKKLPEKRGVDKKPPPPPPEQPQSSAGGSGGGAPGGEPPGKGPLSGGGDNCGDDDDEDEKDKKKDDDEKYVED